MKSLPEPTLREHEMLTWESQACQFPECGPPDEVVYELGENIGYNAAGEQVTSVHCLRYYNASGVLDGILYYYPEDSYGSQAERKLCRMFGQDERLEVAGNVNVFVAPHARRRGIATTLAMEARRRWPEIDPYTQRYSDDGWAWISKLIERDR